MSLSVQQYDALLPFIERLNTPPMTAPDVHTPGDLSLFWAKMEVAGDLSTVIYENGWMTPFDWGEWLTTARELIENPEKLASADLDTVQKLFTTHVRQERFAMGHLVEMAACGHLQQILQRVRALRIAQYGPLPVATN